MESKSQGKKRGNCGSGNGMKKKKKETTTTMIMKKKKRGAARQVDCSRKERTCINDDMVREILCRLPYKPLARARSVCKSWNLWTRDAQFLQTYRRRRLRERDSPPHYFLVFDYVTAAHSSSSPTTTTVNLYGIGRDCFTPKKAIASIPYSYKAVISCSCGLVCIRGGGPSDRRIAVFNPTTNELMPLPDLPHPLLAFTITYEVPHDNPFPFPAGVDVHDRSRDARILNIVGFGHHPPTNRYKVVMLLRDPAARIGRCYVLTVLAAGGSWRALEESLPYESNLYGAPACIDGVLYWQNFGWVDEKVKIVSFDLGTEKLRMDPTPWTYKLTHPSQPTRHLAELDGRLCFVKTETRRSSNGLLFHMEIWSLISSSKGNIGDLKSWSHLHSLELGPCPSSPPYIAYFPLYIDQNNNQIILFDHRDNKPASVYSYHLQDKCLKVYGDDDDDPLITWIMSTYSATFHAEAFVSLD